MLQMVGESGLCVLLAKRREAEPIGRLCSHKSTVDTRLKLLCHQLGLHCVMHISRPDQWFRNNNIEWTRNEKSSVPANTYVVTHQSL